MTFQSSSGGEGKSWSVLVALTAAHAQKQGAWGEGEITTGRVGSKILESAAASLKELSWKGAQSRAGACVCVHMCVLSVLWPTPAVAPGFPAQVSSASVARHCHLFIEGNTVT